MTADSSHKPIPLTRPFFPAEMRRAIASDIETLLGSGRLMMGPFMKKVEAGFQGLTGTADAVSLNSATTGLQIAMRYAGARGRKVLVPAASFVSDAGAVLMEGATPVLVDCDPKTLALDVKDLERKIGRDTAAVIWVHLTGYVSEDYRQIRTIVRDAGAVLIEDASHAHGAEIDGRRAGSLGDVSVFSLYPTKIISSGTGGVLASDNPEITALARSLRMFGKDDKTGDIINLGNDWFMDEIRACVAAHQVAAMPDIVAARRRAAARYVERLANRENLKVLQPDEGHSPGWYQFPVFLKNNLEAPTVIARLAEQGVAGKQIYKPLHRESLFRDLDRGGLQGAEQLLDTSVCLPMMTDITDEEIDRVSDALIVATEQ